MPATRKNAKRPASDPTPARPAKKIRQATKKVASKNDTKNTAKATEAKKDEKGKLKPKKPSTSKNTKTTTKKNVASPKGWNEPEFYELSATDYLCHALNVALLIASLWQSS
ncbi:uncharacterized protein N7503_006347 [Penicillium pulvis]|uniref:uncharacterized protein n=1 Tax=Penicillium pulvis TaxID=1562058 RepID=UPI002549C017|nr:uncharacterized protein N7503_006347 [Penicillium pulvis]KAJ5798842.1 hypothetical protein N7503_006347 [Penicillium pulvis]